MTFNAADIEKPPATVFSYLLYHGGIEPRTRSCRPDALSFDEREFISRSLVLPDSRCTLPRTLTGRHPWLRVRLSGPERLIGIRPR